ncbi:MAG: acyl-CoA dehydrogenase family protein [Acidimicrobiales bacterium]|jgi:alkylation response protein AidB-like acyl-CoA dehydrogenase|nr:acyl-CoA dehydrogenase family protein [Acidimicrobiales bacterium]MDP6902224.1 acyl-CoA dehydrogenase family protein [Acidimicrobiales bacterium]HJL99697.1 acyl-CoA dehydrogenase family protein [Acidimicrobiales bacterium]
MSDTAATTNNSEETQVTSAIDALLSENDPKKMSYEEFRGAQFDHGLAWVYFDEGSGGLGVNPVLQRHVEVRLREAGASPMKPAMFFMHLAGPTIHTHGDKESKDRFLRPMFTGEERWCQLFSEPGAGSDFAGLATRAIEDGDSWIVNGQKVWNTMAHLGDWGMLVTRTDPDMPKHRGMTYFAMDMKSPGVDVQPLRQITGEAEFNEVFLTDVQIPDSNRIGDVGDGWRVSLTTLMNERNAIGAGSGGGPPKAGSGPVAILTKMWRDTPQSGRNSVTRDRIMKLYVRSEAQRLTNIRAGQNRRKGNPGPEMSIAKLAFAELNQDLLTAAVDMMGMAGQVDYDYTFRRPEDLSVDGSENGVQHGFLRVRANSIEGGTSEIMRNILGEQVLGLPGEPRIDKDIPWIEVPRS